MTYLDRWLAIELAKVELELVLTGGENLDTRSLTHVSGKGSPAS